MSRNVAYVVLAGIYTYLNVQIIHAAFFSTYGDKCLGAGAGILTLFWDLAWCNLR